MVISTTPTEKGNQGVDLYNMFFPVKRIKDKPVNTLKRETWVLAEEAEKLGFIKIDLKFEWELSSSERVVGERDAVYCELIKYYYDVASGKHS